MVPFEDILALAAKEGRMIAVVEKSKAVSLSEGVVLLLFP